MFLSRIKNENRSFLLHCRGNVAIGPSQHPLHFLSTHPFQYIERENLTNKNLVEFQHNPPVEIGNDVWIGANVVIMDGLKIGDGAVIGANAVVTKNIPPYAIAVGIPAKVIKYHALMKRQLKNYCSGNTGGIGHIKKL